MAEVRTMTEGVLWWVQASGSGTTWGTASAPTSGLIGYARSMSYTSAETHAAVSDRGIPNHWKRTDRAPIDFTINFAWTGYQPTAVSGSGASVPMFHVEYKAVQPELGNTGRYVQFHGVVTNSIQFTEGNPEDTIALSMQALAMNGPTASGFLS